MSNLAGITRRNLLIRAGAGVLGSALLGACSTVRPTSGQPTASDLAAIGSTPTSVLVPTSATVTRTAGTSATAGPTATQTPRSGGMLRYGTIGDYSGLDAGNISLQLADNLW